jgi:hypothetical protein
MRQDQPNGSWFGWYEPDWTGSSLLIHAADGLLELYAVTCGGNEHSLVMTADGSMTVTHVGRRRSVPGLLLEFLGEEWDQFNKTQDWVLIDSHSSQPEWAVVIGSLAGKFGDGPENLSDLEAQIEAGKMAVLRQKFLAAGRPDPVMAGYHYCGAMLHDGDLNPVTSLGWTGVEYRRAAANGVAL